MDPAVEGTEYPDVRFVVDPVRVAAFRAVFGWEGGVPPTNPPVPPGTSPVPTLVTPLPGAPATANAPAAPAGTTSFARPIRIASS